MYLGIYVLSDFSFVFTLLNYNQCLCFEFNTFHKIHRQLLVLAAATLRANHSVQIPLFAIHISRKPVVSGISIKNEINNFETFADPS